jgi:hypothetical protein
MPKPRSQGARGRTYGDATPRLAQVVEISVDVTWGEAFERITLLVQVEEETPNVPVSDPARGQRPPLSLALYLKAYASHCTPFADTRLIAFATK